MHRVRIKLNENKKIEREVKPKRAEFSYSSERELRLKKIGNNLLNNKTEWRLEVHREKHVLRRI